MALVVTAGLAVGVATAYACGRYVQGQLFELRADDPLVFAIALATLLGAAGIATLIPALRASRLSIVRALRHE
jgi:ABC-type lipoprotein release transport system permease subunit